MTATLVRIWPGGREFGNQALPPMSLLHHCVRCEESCCKGRTLVRRDEMELIRATGHPDYSRRWSEDIHYLDHGPCAYLQEGLCSVQAVKPFVCQIFPFVPRAELGTWWLYLVSECPAQPLIPAEFITRAVELAKGTLKAWDLQEYESYWNENKVGDFRDDRVRLLIPVYPHQFIAHSREKVKMISATPIAVPGCVGTYVEVIGERPGFQVLRVSVENGGEIPLHAHDCVATMVILEGSARTLGKDGRRVKTGDVVVKGIREPHGFTDVRDGFSFLSISTGEGILQGSDWDLNYV